MSNLEDWPYKWFGYWSEYGQAYGRCPSIKEFVCAEVSRSYDREMLRKYLTEAQCIAATSRMNFVNPFTGTYPFHGSLGVCTDGEWVWYDDLPFYIEEHDLAIPTKFLEHIKANGYIPPPDVDEDTYMSLDFPEMIV
jgi:hypothetical protein